MFPLDDTKTTNSVALWTIIFIALNVYFFFQEITSLNPDLFIQKYALIPQLVDFTNLQTLKPFVTSQFLHAGFLHLISNMWFLWIFGDNVEDRAGFVLFPFLYLISGAAGAFLQFLFLPDSPIPMLGASGAIAGVLGAYFAWFPYHKIRTLIPIFILPAIIEIPASIMLFYWFATQILAGGSSIISSQNDLGGIAYFAHIGGFVTGWILAKLISPVNTQQLSG